MQFWKFYFCLLILAKLVMTQNYKLDVILPNDLSLETNLKYIESITNLAGVNITINYHRFIMLNTLVIKQKICATINSGMIFAVLPQENYAIVKELVNLGYFVISNSYNSYSTDVNYDFSLDIPEALLFDKVKSINFKNIQKEIYIYYNNKTNLAWLQRLSLFLTKDRNQIGLVNVDSMSQSLNRFMIERVQRKIRYHFIVLNSLESTLNILKSAQSTKVLRQNFFWTILNKNISSPSEILSILTSKDCPNIALVKPGLSTLNNLPCNSTMCANPIIQSFYNTLKLLINISLVNPQSIWRTINCIHGNFNNYNNNISDISAVIQTSDIWKSMKRSSQTVEIYATSSRDITHSTPNLFTYSTQMIATTDRTNNHFANEFNGWNNKSIYLCAPPITPVLIYLTNNTYSSLNQIAGLMFDVLTVLSKAMNFVPYLYESPDKFWGIQMPGEPMNFTGCIGEVFNEKSLMGFVGFTVNYDRKSGVDFSIPFMDEANSAMIRYPVPESKLWVVLRPLKFESWIIILACMIIASLVSYLLAYFSPLSAWNLELDLAIIDEIRVREHIWNVVGSFLMQGQDFYPYCMSARTVLAIWWLFSVIIFSVYSADLTSFLTVRQEGQLLTTIDQLAQQKEYRIVVTKDTITDRTLQESDYDVYQELLKRVYYVTKVDECTSKVLDPNSDKFVCINDLSPIRFKVNQNCSQVYIIPQKFINAPLAFPIQSDAAYGPMLNVYLTKLMESGNIEKWIEKNWAAGPTASGCSRGESDEGQPIELEGVVGVYIILAITYVVAFVFLCSELLWKHYKKPLNKFLCQH